MSTTRVLFSYQSKPHDADGAGKCQRLEEALRAAGIEFTRHWKGYDCERTVPDPDSPQGWTVELDSVEDVDLAVSDADAERARAVLAGLK